MNKKIIICIVIVIIAVIACIAYTGLNNNQTNKAIEENGKLNTYFDLPTTAGAGGDSNFTFEFTLRDMENNPIPNANATITYQVNDQNKTINVTTDDSGHSKTSAGDADTGFGDIVYKYAGDDKYNPCESKVPFGNVNLEF